MLLPQGEATEIVGYFDGRRKVKTALWARSKNHLVPINMGLLGIESTICLSSPYIKIVTTQILGGVSWKAVTALIYYHVPILVGLILVWLAQ